MTESIKVDTNTEQLRIVDGSIAISYSWVKDLLRINVSELLLQNWGDISELAFSSRLPNNWVVA